jgi:galactokinase
VHDQDLPVALMQMEVPEATSLRDIYPEDAIDAQAERWEHLLQAFKREYGNLPGFVARSPGRVNLIGEVCAMWGNFLN